MEKIIVVETEKVIVISEECHGFIGIVKTAQDIIPFLVDTEWLDGYTELYNYNANQCWKSVAELFGDNWQEILEHKTIDELETIFDGRFYFSNNTVYHRL